jgi:BASS family bile acid:Na+ symporter
VLVVLLVVSPVLAFGAAAALGLPGGLGAALVLMATGCAATSSPAFARLVGLDGDVSFAVAILSTLLVPFTAPPLALGLLGLDLALSVWGLMGRLSLVVGLPLCLSLLLRRVLGRERLDRGGRAVDGAVVWLVVFYGFGVMDGMLARLLADPAWVLGGLMLAFAAAAVLNLLTAGLMWWAGRRRARRRAVVGQQEHGAVSGGAAGLDRSGRAAVLRPLPVPAVPVALPAEAGLRADQALGFGRAPRIWAIA